MCPKKNWIVRWYGRTLKQTGQDKPYFCVWQTVWIRDGITRCILMGSLGIIIWIWLFDKYRWTLRVYHADNIFFSGVMNICRGYSNRVRMMWWRILKIVCADCLYHCWEFLFIFIKLSLVSGNKKLVGWSYWNKVDVLVEICTSRRSWVGYLC